MNGDRGPASSPVEERLDEHLELLRRDDLAAHAALTTRIVHRARWQRALRAPVQMAAAIVGSVADGLRTLIGGPRR